MDDVCGDPCHDQKTFGLNETQFGLLIAMPVFTGLLICLPPGMLTDKLGGRLVLLLVMVFTIILIYLISLGTECWHYLITGLFVGVVWV